MHPFLIVVHPGSCCGSADFNLGDDEAEAMRTRLVDDLDAWNGGVAVIDGDLSSELRQRAFRPLGLAIEQAIERAAAAGLPSMRIRGDAEEDFNQTDAARTLVSTFDLAAGRTKVEITGAWYDGGAGDGCIDTVVATLDALGIRSSVRASAASLDETPTSPEADEQPAFRI